MTNPFLEDMKIALPWLFREMGFRVTSQGYYYKLMGSAVVDLDSGSIPLRLRFVCDQLSVVAQVAPVSGSEWANVYRVLEAINGELPESAPSLEAQAVLFRDHLSELEEAMGPRWPETMQELERLHQVRLRAAMTPRPVSARTHLGVARLRWRRPAIFLGLVSAAALVAWIAWH
jgi:hypothetical protein